MYSRKSSPSSTGPPRKSTKRRMSEPDLMIDRKEVLVVDGISDDEPIFLGTSRRGTDQLSLGDLWGHQRSDEAGPEGAWKRPRVAKKKQKIKPQTQSKSKQSQKKPAKPITYNNNLPPNLSSSIGSPTPSDQRSIFSIDTDSSSHSELTDGFTELDLAFNPALFPLEIHPIHGIHPSWLEPLKPILIQPEIISLHQQLGPNYLGYDYKLNQKAPHRLREIAPAAHDLYNWTRLTPLDQVKVVILAPSVHHHSDQTHGLAFSQPTTCTRLSGAIRAIHRELGNQYPERFIRPRHGSLVSWARAGVLLLNIIQTAQRDKDEAHSRFGWQVFATRILEIVSRQGGGAFGNPHHHHHQLSDQINPLAPHLDPAHSNNGIVFIGWGEEAIQQIRASGVASSARNHKILTSPEAPSACSTDIDGFSHQNHFRLANEYLSSTYGPQHAVDWCDLRPLDPHSNLCP
ncbi:hypothetical protein PGT21_006064 [Puccinia graminis f. sp. tritici]|uniref:Uracil-DNA glycosylase-like domain-containing protein n=1 Tax=Puccinia graminis f. sp. tritici TaxID=56615 RepID=A0A5B0LYL7_PUCGR|nr:hypothetical protein PGT21_006064 [Puccinia graminis f. sp. tritici]